MAIMELHQLVSLCRSETDAFQYLFQKEKRTDEKFLSPLQGVGILFQVLSAPYFCRVPFIPSLASFGNR